LLKNYTLTDFPTSAAKAGKENQPVIAALKALRRPKSSRSANLPAT
jgi:hypothetical protein